MNRKFLASALSLALVALSPLTAHAGSGRAYLPYLGVVSGAIYTTVTREARNCIPVILPFSAWTAGSVKRRPVPTRRWH
jgi:hypothetical protein